MGCYLGQEAGVSASTQRATYDTDMAFGESKQGGVAEALGTEPACTERTVGVGGREDGQEGQRRGGVGGGGEGRAGGTRIGRNGAGALEPWVTGSHLYRKQAGDPEQALPAVLGEPLGSLSRGPLGAAWWPLLPPQLETGWPHVPGRRTCCPAAWASAAPWATGIPCSRSRWPQQVAQAPPSLGGSVCFQFPGHTLPPPRGVVQAFPGLHTLPHPFLWDQPKHHLLQEALQWPCTPSPG